MQTRPFDVEARIPGILQSRTTPQNLNGVDWVIDGIFEEDSIRGYTDDG